MGPLEIKLVFEKEQKEYIIKYWNIYTSSYQPSEDEKTSPPTDTGISIGLFNKPDKFILKWIGHNPSILDGKIIISSSDYSQTIEFKEAFITTFTENCSTGNNEYVDYNLTFTSKGLIIDSIELIGIPNK